MSEINTNGTKLYFEEMGSGSETFVFSHSFALSGYHFIHQMKYLQNRYRCLAFDHRGLGQSEVTENGYELDNLLADAVGFVEATRSAPCHFVGLSMGGFIGMMMAIRRPDLLKSLILMDTAADGMDYPKIILKVMSGVISLLGWKRLSGLVLRGMFGKKFISDPDRKDDVAQMKNIIKANNTRSTIKIAESIFSWKGVYEELHTISVPTLMIVGEKDRGTPVKMAERIVDQIPNSRLVVIPNAAHLSPFEEPGAVNTAIQEFLDSQK